MFYYGLALRLGYASVDRMLSEMKAYEVAEWIGYFEIKQLEEAIGRKPDDDDLGNAQTLGGG